MKNTVVIKDRDEWSSLAEFIGNMVAKYAEAMDFESLPNPDKYLTRRYLLNAYKSYIRERNKKSYSNINTVCDIINSEI